MGRCPAVALIDISPPIHPAIGVWPGDVPYRMDKSMDIESGSHLDLGSMHTTFHVGAHTDAHRHYLRGGADAASMPLEPYYGPCQVIAVRARKGKRFGFGDLQEPVDAERVLLKTGTFDDHEEWNTDFAAPEAALIDALHGMGVQLVGFDTPSTDLFDSKDVPAHKRLAATGMVNLEGLRLDHVAPGHYTLVAFPLPLVGADASPVRAVLVDE